MSYISMKQLLEAGVHFGHETKRWNPKFKKFIFAERNGIFIIDLQKTLKQVDRSFDYIKDLAERGGVILFVGTKKQAQEIVELEARRTGMPYVTSRWLGGMLTNFKTMRTRIDRLNELDDLFESERINDRPKAERIQLASERERLLRFVGGIRKMNRLPDAIFVVDPTKEVIAVQEANKLGIPVIALADTDSDPDVIDYIVPGNDDAIRSIQLITHRVGDLLVEARGGHEDVSAGPVEEQSDEAQAAEQGTEGDTAQLTSSQGRS
ncbi:MULTISPECIES: 30S ribosomal protein S2 [Deinococcus]|jgi:SSU ribosomal protein S2P|uniref:Small ribosomal subunit protein uS2 n=1 Tax=Deinococcus radiodurans (strain ATCC 13939 / DSM 20539 / JCM 16871 / CCUG 27074 / LMG 4051 / NBRC 15346 / NCIMB 9279 / VKM B-1422 / R1) TaxID=243230 RepID=RS2_DEIRA|nr:30S ribosomal protein S2 [Deinococcus radiodurans]Q9RU79.1 RecName: Full=Small ribosomal subunit protein uS2; AltName: Full=30S ribosomal protein S2 [Deinococcus radiodurans R1 = ATCC 13939 = DSM 20539]AAF11080.1 ribosomal protein S2 [Deinococcus radiodurans R1 = ATCC 13939 = DSM 20539]ANC71360.1 30S ribosomal protein S2 [Deinococcus radiodurans R1 = ATCC 13939 = DSM 20539]QEM70957.1 30S ribosomal protein S2 [Deinococcus radiodurans]QIP29516.1 30S ribosomal protein S2 [Deinococcus radiodura